MEHSPDPCTILLSEDFRMEPSLGSLHRYLYCETSARSLQHKIFAWGLHVGPLYGTFVGDLCMGPSSQDLLMGPLLHDLHARPYVGGPPRGTFTRGPSGSLIQGTFFSWPSFGQLFQQITQLSKVDGVCSLLVSFEKKTKLLHPNLAYVLITPLN